MRAYSNDLRERVIADRKAGLESLEIAEKYSVSRSWVNDLWLRYRKTGSFEPKKMGGHKKPILQERAAEIRKAMEDKPDSTLKELRERLGFTGSLQTVSSMLLRLGYSFKKNNTRFRTRST